MRVLLVLIISLHLLASSNLSLKKAGINVEFKDIKGDTARIKLIDKSSSYSVLILGDCKSKSCQNISSLQLVTWLDTDIKHKKLLDIANKLNKDTIFSTFYVTKQTIVLKSNILATKKEQVKKLLNFLGAFMAIKNDFLKRMKNE